MQNRQNPQYNQNYQDKTTKVDQFGPFFNPDGSLVLDWVGEKARQTSEQMARATPQLTSTGLRNFYNEFLRIKDLPESHKQEKIILIKLLVAKVEYKKTTKKVPFIFVEFINQLVKEIGESTERFEKACLIMEALVGFNPKK
ncbi:MAG: type III-A CRISPR-associated protein Csm2 [Candidatus Cloacimonetes bacterium]|jgi:CRISPR type III-A-associated protein Csm2|nr:type III-A CRISPR-associated protein Csm2 [Candidatus Cloacimonadota bacterium]